MMTEGTFKDSMERYRQLVELCPAGIAVFKRGSMIYLNPSGMNLLGTDQLVDVIGTRPWDWVVENKRVMKREVFGEIQKNGCVKGKELIIRKVTGEIIDIAAGVIYDQSSGTLEIVFEDITQRKRDEEARRMAEDLIRESEDRYFRLQMSLDQFSSGLFGTIEMEDVNQRFIKEVSHVVRSRSVSLVEMGDQTGLKVISGDPVLQTSIVRMMQEMGPDALPVCLLMDTLDGHFLKIAEIQGKSFILCINENCSELIVQAVRIWLETVSRYVSVLYDNFRVIGDLQHELNQLSEHQSSPVWVLRLMFQLSEKERRNLAQDLHDAALQEQIVWYRKLDEVISSAGLSDSVEAELEQIKQGLLDVMYQIRITCNELRPPLLKELGIEKSLEELFAFTQLRSDYTITFHCTQLQRSLSIDLLLHLYRIVQEMLANASKHSNASEVEIVLNGSGSRLFLSYKDNGVGMNLRGSDHLHTKMGVYGIKERVRSLQGDIKFTSELEQGLEIHISIPTA
ncbi:sensor histidine kinase [Paenibacillus lemnae]|nr:ATP-binding protein [Paenibacillus lemnae]